MGHQEHSWDQQNLPDVSEKSHCMLAVWLTTACIKSMTSFYLFIYFKFNLSFRNDTISREEKEANQVFGEAVHGVTTRCCATRSSNRSCCAALVSHSPAFHQLVSPLGNKTKKFPKLASEMEFPKRKPDGRLQVVETV